MDMSTLIWGFLFGTVGFAYFVYGKKQEAIVPLLCGVVLMVFPYFISNTLLLAAVGIGLIILPFVLRR